jgi:hypothetical protein
VEMGKRTIRTGGIKIVSELGILGGKSSLRKEVVCSEEESSRTLLEEALAGRTGLEARGRD